ncbi:MAG: radical SAM protein [Bacilli bacterium]|nr:radical SAM protein [Bacilli bacterium]
MNPLTNCTLCPRNCNVNRYKNLGYCKQSNKIKLALAKLFFYEEPPISGKNGSGTIFFTGCNLKCLFCQNYDISTKNIGKTVSIKRLSEIMLELQSKKAHNINLVTPTIYVPQIIKAIKKAKKNGLDIPIIYNSSGYENLETIKMLKGYIDVYLPDFKYYDNNIAIKYSSAKDYFKYASASIQEMIKQVGSCKFDKNGMITKGVIVRHLLLPTHLEDSKKIIKYLSQYKDDIYLSIMNQYTPIRKLKYEELNHPVKKDDYYELIDYAVSLNIKNAFCQEDETVSESFIPIWNFEGVEK